MNRLKFSAIVAAVSAIVIGYLGLTVFDSNNAPTPKTLDIPPILTADAGSGRSLTMNIVGIEGILPNELIPISSFKWNIGSAPEPEITTDKFGRVKVQFCWDGEGKTEDSSCWIRVAQPWAGKKWGAMFIPRIGQEVIVNFLEGEPDHPIIAARIITSNARIISTSYSLSDESIPMAEFSFEFDTIKWEFKDVHGDSFCAGLDVQGNQLLDCQHLL